MPKTPVIVLKVLLGNDSVITEKKWRKNLQFLTSDKAFQSFNYLIHNLPNACASLSSGKGFVLPLVPLDTCTCKHV